MQLTGRLERENCIRIEIEQSKIVAFSLKASVLESLKKMELLK